MSTLVRVFTVILIMLLTACSDNISSPQNGTSDVSLPKKDAQQNDVLDASPDISSTDDAGDAESNNATSLPKCSEAEAPSISINLAGFGASANSACSQFESEPPVSQGTVMSVDERQLLVELADGSPLEFKDWDGPALNTVFELDETVDVAAPCSYQWSLVRGAKGTVAALNSTPSQLRPRDPIELEELPSFLNNAPSFSIQPFCQIGDQSYNALKINIGDAAPTRMTTSGIMQVGDWTVGFGGSQWCCQRAGGEAPETRSDVYLYRVD